MSEVIHKGSCDCGAVVFEVTGELRAVTLCHCGQCRKTSGHIWAATQVPTSNLNWIKSDCLTWYRSSDFARRGFCSGCGASLFYERDGEGKTAIGAGTLDGPTGLNVAKHIFTKNKGDYYEIADSAPQIERY